MARPRLVHPYPVAEGRWPDGRTIRMSIAQEIGKPADRRRAERMLCDAYATATGLWSGTAAYCALPPGPPPASLEIHGEAPATAKPRRSALTRADDRLTELLAAARALLAGDPGQLDALTAAVAAYAE